MNKESVIVVDLFGISPIEYRPFLLRHRDALASAKKVIFYHSHLQDKEVSESLGTLKGMEGCFPLQIWLEPPMECINEKD